MPENYTTPESEATTKITAVKSYPIMTWRPHLFVNIETDADYFGCEQSRTTPVFTRPGGRAILGGAASHAWKRMVRELGSGYEDTGFHDTRHTHATKLLMEGTRVSGVQERLRHRRESTTTDIYKHIIEGVQKTAIEQFEEKRTEKRRIKTSSATRLKQ